MTFISHCLGEKPVITSLPKSTIHSFSKKHFSRYTIVQSANVFGMWWKSSSQSLCGGCVWKLFLVRKTLSAQLSDNFFVENETLRGCLRSYPCENTRSHPNSEVKHMWAGLVEWWVTTFESPVLQTFFFFFFFFF